MMVVSFELLALDAPPIPTGIEGLLNKDDTILALKSAQPLGATSSGTVILVRHTQANDSHSNPCELLLIQTDATTSRVAARNEHIVDCRYNESAKSAAAMGLLDNLKVTPTSVSYFNELTRGGTTFTFAWNPAKAAWNLQHVEATSVQNTEGGVTVFKSVLDYPATLPWIALSEFDPKAIREALVRNRAIVR
ncbi:hypothetical protein KPL74_04595 [Bacillus sp. NP157]|nr:hypothetical protein KPL74_04595 [Bacillus sp. NP157]